MPAFTSNTTLASFPEELIERVLEYSVPSQASTSHPSWQPPVPHGTSAGLAPLLVCKTWTRIATPVMYHTVHLQTPAQARNFAGSPCASSVRALVMAGCWPREMREIARVCLKLETLDITIDSSSSGEEERQECWSRCFEGINLRHLVLRKVNDVYLSHGKARAVIFQLSRAVPHWKNLHTVHIAFKLSADASGVAQVFANVLATSSSLTQLLAELPVVWNPILLTISTNQRLQRIVLNPESDGVLGTSPFIMEAYRYERLMELIRAGTPIMRSRPHYSAYGDIEEQTHHDRRLTSTKPLASPSSY